MAETSIRPFGGGDLAGVLSVWNRALRRDQISEGRFVQLILGDGDYWPGEDSGFFVATRGDVPVGFARAIIRRWPNDRLGLEPTEGFVPLLAVDPQYQRQGIGTALVGAVLDYFRKHGRKRAWVCGTTTSAPGSFVPGVDKDAYPGAMALLTKLGFVVDQQAFSMAREIVDFDVDFFERMAWEVGRDVDLMSLTPEFVQDFLLFVAEALPGAWNIAGRAKVRSGALHEMLIARLGGRIVGYCQWTGEHFGPFGVAPAVRNQRIGAKLFTEAVRRIREADGRTVWFNWADANAARFYRRFGLHDTRCYDVLRKEV